MNTIRGEANGIRREVSIRESIILEVGNPRAPTLCITRANGIKAWYVVRKVIILGSVIKYRVFMKMSEILAANWHPWTYSRTWTISSVSAHSWKYAHTFLCAPKPLVFHEIGPLRCNFLSHAFTTLTVQKPRIVKLSSNLILLWTCFPSTPPLSWPLFVKFTKSGANFAGTYLYGERSGRYSEWELVIVHWWLSTVAIVANYEKHANFHCGPYHIALTLTLSLP